MGFVNMLARMDARLNCIFTRKPVSMDSSSVSSLWKRYIKLVVVYECRLWNTLRIAMTY
jgi:hypothetical protein